MYKVSLGRDGELATRALPISGKYLRTQPEANQHFSLQGEWIKVQTLHRKLVEITKKRSVFERRRRTPTGSTHVSKSEKMPSGRSFGGSFSSFRSEAAIAAVISDLQCMRWGGVD
jgi:hypothetical protein